jgi:hypothetical protein
VIPDIAFPQDVSHQEVEGAPEALFEPAHGPPDSVPPGIPFDDVLCFSEAPDGTQWFGTSIGAARLWNGQWSYFQGRRWLPDDRVEQVLAHPGGGAWLRTPDGTCRIQPELITLAAKARHFETHVRDRHFRDGFVAECRLEAPGDTSRWQHIAEDNDGLWTALYVAAQCYRFAATGDDEARRLACESMNALLDLERLTPTLGYPARAIARRDERVVRSDWEKGRWHEEPSGLQWKGDTSADELDGHFFAYSLFHDLVADDDQRAEVRAVATRIIDHVIEHGWLLVEDGRLPWAGGTHTTWGVYAPHLLNDPNSRYHSDQGLFSLCILSHLKVVEQMWREVDASQADRYLTAYRELAQEHGYAENALLQNHPPPFRQNHSDDEMAFIAYEPLLRYERDPALRQLYLRALRKDWEIERPERSPFTNFLYAAAAHTTECDAQAAVQTLREIPLSQVRWGMRNSHRRDLPRDPNVDRFRAAQSSVALKASERDMQRWNANPYRLDSDGDGLTEGDGVYYLLPYWLGVYLGVIAAQPSPAAAQP